MPLVGVLRRAFLVEDRDADADAAWSANLAVVVSHAHFFHRREDASERARQTLLRVVFDGAVAEAALGELLLAGGVIEPENDVLPWG